MSLPSTAKTTAIKSRSRLVRARGESLGKRRGQNESECSPKQVIKRLRASVCHVCPILQVENELTAAGWLSMCVRINISQRGDKRISPTTDQSLHPSMGEIGDWRGKGVIRRASRRRTQSICIRSSPIFFGENYLSLFCVEYYPVVLILLINFTDFNIIKKCNDFFFKKFYQRKEWKIKIVYLLNLLF